MCARSRPSAKSTEAGCTRHSFKPCYYLVIGSKTVGDRNGDPASDPVDTLNAFDDEAMAGAWSGLGRLNVPRLPYRVQRRHWTKRREMIEYGFRQIKTLATRIKSVS